MAEQNENANTEVKNEAKYTDADVDAIINKKFAAWQEKQNKAIDDAVAKVEEAHRLASMSEKEKAEAERKAEQEELNKLRAEKAHNEMLSTARQMLNADGLSIPDDIISVLVTDNADTTKDAIKAFSGMFQKAVDEAVKAKLAGSEPKKGGSSAMSKEDIMAIPDTHKRLQAIRDNIELFNKGE